MGVIVVLTRDYATVLSVEGGQEVFIDEPIKH